MHLYRRAFTLRTNHQALTTTPCQPQALATNRSDCMGGPNASISTTFSSMLRPAETVVADLLSHSVDILVSTSCSDSVEYDLIQLLHAPLQATVSLQEHQQASEQDPTLNTLHLHQDWMAIPSALGAAVRSC